MVFKNVKARAELPEIHCSESDKNSRLAPASGKMTATPMEPTQYFGCEMYNLSPLHAGSLPHKPENALLDMHAHTDTSAHGRELQPVPSSNINSFNLSDVPHGLSFARHAARSDEIAPIQRDRHQAEVRSGW
jgi:hypothetical protein